MLNGNTMHQASLFLTALLMLCITVVMAPGILHLNRGKALQTVALWLAVFVGLALIYKNFGPDSAHPLFHLPESMAPAPAPAVSPDLNRG